MSKTKKTDAELHVAAELEHFAAKGSRMICRGRQEQDLGKVLASIERTARSAERSAERKERQAVAAQATGDEGESGRLAQAAAAQRGVAKGLDALTELVLDAAGKVKPLVEGGVETEHVIAFLLRSGLPDEAAEMAKQARVGCGADLSEVIAALPRPCDSEPYTCPKCGREGHASKTAHAQDDEA